MTTTTENTRIKELYDRERAETRPVRRLRATAARPEDPDGPLVDGHESVANRVSLDSSDPSYGSLGPNEEGESPENLAEEASAPETSAAETTESAVADEADEGLLLDAYWASFGDAPTRAMMRSARARASVLEVILPEGDRRTQITATNQAPWRYIASILITAQTGTTYIGTAWLVSPRLMLTAGHCVFLQDEGGWASRIEVIPGRNGADRPFGSCSATSFRSTRAWTERAAREYDYGAIMLPETCRYGDQLGWFGYQTRSDGDLQDTTVNLSGYPGDKPPGTQWFHANNVSQVEDRVVTYQIDTAGGQSGSPVWVYVPDRGRYGVAIHTNGHITGNSGVRITGEVAGNITAWRDEVP